MTAAQAHAVADAALRDGSGVIEATNRSNLQIRGIQGAAAEHAAMVAPLLAAGLGPANAASDDVRNLMLSPSAGIDCDQLVDTWPLARELLASLEGTPRFSELSAKFALQLDGGEALAMLEHHHDLWLSAIQHDGRLLWAFGLAGSPARGPALGAVPIEQGHELALSVLLLFLDLARPEHIRMRHLLQTVPVETFVEQLALRLSVSITPVPRWRRPANPLALSMGTYLQREAGLTSVVAVAPLGRLSAAMLRGLAQIACDDGDGTLRFTPWQSVLLPNIRAENAPAVTRHLQTLGWLCDAQDPLAHLIACTGSSACAKGMADTKQDARQLATLLSHPLGVHLTGCPRSCAAAHVAPVTLLAVAPGHYDLYSSTPEQSGFGILRERNLTIEAAGAWLEARQRSNTDD